MWPALGGSHHSISNQKLRMYHISKNVSTNHSKFFLMKFNKIFQIFEKFNCSVSHFEHKY